MQQKQPRLRDVPAAPRRARGDRAPRRARATAAATPPAAAVTGCTSFKLRQLTRRVSQHHDVELAHAGLKTTQYSLLSHVAGLGPLRPVDLARAMTMDASTLTRNLRPLVDAGWVEQRDGPDARSRLIHITPAGRAKRAEARLRWQQAQQALNERLGIDQVRALHACIDEALARLAPTPAGEGDD